jgi:hypothetical protein
MLLGRLQQVDTGAALQKSIRTEVERGAGADAGKVGVTR